MNDAQNETSLYPFFNNAGVETAMTKSPSQERFTRMK